MQIIEGKYNVAKIFTDVVDERAVEQIRTVCDSAVFSDCKIRIMPDVHAGAGCTIGTTMTVRDKLVPNMVGVDIGCGMELVRVAERDIDFAELDALIRKRIPSGFDVREKPHPLAQNADIEGLRCYRKIDGVRAVSSIGTLGGGNHFIEADKDEFGNVYLIVHSGSRHLGVEVAEYYQEEGYKRLCGNSRKQLDELIAAYRAEGRAKEIQRALAESKKAATEIPRELAYVEGELFDDYIHDMKIVQAFAALNRKAMINELVDGMRLTVVDGFTTIHNYIDTDSMILRKGAVSAKAGERLLIPINMRDGSLICVGKGNDDWNCSAPHGAGRLMSRAKAMRELTLDEFEQEMRGVFSTSVGRDTLDESPMAYKRLEDITDNITPTAEITARITPLYNFKAAETSPIKRK